MIRTIAICAVASAALSVPATACQAAPGNHAYAPVMANHIREATGIYLARAVSAERLPDDQQPLTGRLQPIYRYAFNVLETIKGDPVASFSMDGRQPFSAEISPGCRGHSIRGGADAGACATEVENLSARNFAHLTADSGRADWPLFTLISPFGSSGMGIADVFVPDEVIVDCGGGGGAASFELGETFLIMRNRDEAIWDDSGLNNQLITRSDDVWLEAVRAAVAHPERRWLAPRSVREIVGPFGPPLLVTAEACTTTEDDPYVVQANGAYSLAMPQAMPDEVVFFQREEGAADLLDHCAGDGDFIAFPGAISSRYGVASLSALPFFPVHDGLVDFGHLPSQWAIDGSTEIPVSEVITWFDDLGGGRSGE